MRAAILGILLPVMGDSEFRHTLQRVPKEGRELFMWWLEQKWIEDEIHANDDLSRNQVRTKTAESRQRPVAGLTELEQAAFRETVEDGLPSVSTINKTANEALDYYFDRAPTAALSEQA